MDPAVKAIARESNGTNNFIISKLELKGSLEEVNVELVLPIFGS